MNKTYTIKLTTATGSVQTIELKPGQPQATLIEVKGQVNVELVDIATGRAPQKVSVRRVDKNLHIVFEPGENDEPDLVLQGFYDTGENHLIGLAEDGGLFEYVPTSGDNDAYVPLLLDGSGGMQALGGNALGGDGLLAAFAPVAVAGFSPWLLGAIGLGALGAVAAIAGGGSGSGANGGNAVLVPITPTQRPSGYLDNVGPIQAANSTASAPGSKRTAPGRSSHPSWSPKVRIRSPSPLPIPRATHPSTPRSGQC